jgi:hypothetical protein
MHSFPSMRWCREVSLSSFVAASMAGTAQSSEYSCHVPRALLCEGCASHIAISLQADGSCRISFIPEMAGKQATASEAIQFTVEAPTVVTTQHRVIWRARYAGLARPAPLAHCFVFNAQKYCE